MGFFNKRPTGCAIFENDDRGYLRWVADHRNGFVLNSFRQPKSSYLKLHHARCTWVSTSKIGNWTTTGYIKVCAEDSTALQEWAKRETGGELQPCSQCKPQANHQSQSKSKPVAPLVSAIAYPAKPVTSSLPSVPGVGERSIPSTINSGCPELDLLWRKYAADVLFGTRSHILIQDTEEDLNWHAFLGHSLDMQGFRAAEFVGVDALTRMAPGFIPLKTQKIGIRELGELWTRPTIERHLRSNLSGVPLSATLDLLRAEGGQTGRSVADAFAEFPFRKGHWTVRAYLQNSAALKPFGYSFRGWLHEAIARLGAQSVPPTDFLIRTNGTTLERRLRTELERSFYQVGPALAAYMICDWQLGLWKTRRTGVFTTFKLDSFHEEFVDKYGRGVVPRAEQGFADWWLSVCPGVPPRLANECIWLGTEFKDV